MKCLVCITLIEGERYMVLKNYNENIL